jgi:choline dehydrogenase-like flavoprotein
MREHRCLALRYRLRERAGVNHLLATPAGQARQGARYLLTRKGPLATPAYDVLSFLKTRPGLDRPDAQILLAPWSVTRLETGKAVAIEREPGVSACAQILRPTSEGSVAITSGDPHAPLDIDPGYFTSAYDRETAVALMRRMRELFACDPIAGRISHETFPGPDVTDEEEVVRAALDGGYCGFHAMGTCAMGPSEDDVVDSQLRVRGVENLRAVDCSVMPTMVSGNLNGPVMAMAWHASDLIAQGA